MIVPIANPLLMSIFLIYLMSLFFSPTEVQQQAVISGKVLDQEKNAVLPYVNIGIPSKSIGTVTDDKGNFNLKLGPEARENDTLVFSYLGYVSEKRLVSDLRGSSNEILLPPAENVLEPVVLEMEELEPKKIGRTGTGLGMMHWNFYSVYDEVDDQLSRELGMNFKLRESCRLEKFSFAVSNNEFRKLKLRLNIYDVKEGFPDSLLLSDNLIFTLEDGATGWQSIDLAPYDLYLREELGEVAITLQWLESEKATADSKFFSIPASKSPFHTIYSRDKAMDSWKLGTGRLSMYVDARCKG